MGQYKDPIMYSREANPNYMQFKSNPYAPITTMPIENPNNGGGTVDIQVVVYGPDGKMYSSPAAARAAGVTNYTSTPPGSTVMGSKAILKVGGYVNGGMVQHFAEGGSTPRITSYSFDPSLFKDRYGEVRSSDDFAEQLRGYGDLPPNQRLAAVNQWMFHSTGNPAYLDMKNGGYQTGPTALGTDPSTGAQTVRRSTVPEQFQNVKYDDASRKAALDTLRSYNQSVNGVSDAEIAAQMHGLNEWLKIKNSSATTGGATSDTNSADALKQIYEKAGEQQQKDMRAGNAYNLIGAEIAQSRLLEQGINPMGMSYEQMARALEDASFKKYGPNADEKFKVVGLPPPATSGTTPPAGGGNTPPPAPPIVSQTNIAPVVGTKPPGTTGPGVSVAPGTNIPFQPLPGTLQTQPAKADLTKFNPSYEINKNLNPGIGQLPPGFSFDPNKYFSPSQAQTKIAANPNLTPTALGSYTQNTDRLGNVIAIPTIDPLKFQPFYTTPVTRAAGGLVEDDEDTEASGAKQMLKGYEQLTGPRETRVVKSPNAQSVRSRQVSQVVDKQGRPAGMGMTYESMTTAQGPSQASPEQLATAKAMLADLMRQNLTKRRFAEGGETSNFTSGASDKKGAPAKKEKEPEAPGFFDIMDYSAKASTKMFPKQTGADDQRDAARHMLAAALVTKKLGPGMAEFLGKAHERMSNPMSFFNMIGIGEPRYDYPVDVHNNKLGIDLASKSKSQGELEKLVEALSKTSSNEQQPGRPWTVAPEVVQAIMAKQKKMTETPPEYRADGSPEEGEGYMPPTNPFAGKAAKQAEMRAARDERSRVAAAREKVARTPALDEAGGETTDEFIQRTMGLDPSVNEQRGTFLPQRIKRNGKTEFIAPNIVKDAALPFALSSQALTTNRFNEEDVPKAAMNIGAAGLALGKAPAGALASTMRKGKAEAPASIFSPIPSAEAPFVGRLDQFAASMPGVARKDQLLGQLKGKFRDYEMGRAQEALKDLDDAAKISPSDFLNRLKQVDDPARYRTQVVEPEEGSFFSSMDNPWSNGMYRGEEYIPPANLGVIHLIHDKTPEVGMRIENRRKLIRDLNANGGSSLWVASPSSVARLTDEILPRLIQAVPENDRFNRGYINSAKQELSEVGNQQMILAELKRDLEYPRLSADFDRVRKETMDSLGLTRTYEITPEIENSIKQQVRQGVASRFNKNFSSYVTGNDEIPEGLDFNVPNNLDLAVDSIGVAKDAFQRRAKSTVKDLIAHVEGLFPEVNRQNVYRGQHPTLKNDPDPISFSRFSEHKATIPGMGENVPGIYVHELQSDLLDDVRKQGPLGGSAAKDYETVFSPLQQKENELAQELARLNDQRRRLSPADRAAWTATDEARNILQRIDEINTTTRQISHKKQKIRDRMADGTYDMKEAFPGMESSPQVTQQLMAKNAIAAAINRGKSFVAFPGPESSQPQLYEKLPNNLKQVVKDLGPGFEVRMIELPQRQTSADSTAGLKSHVAIVWGPEAADRIKKQGVSFKDGGPVDANAEFIKAHA